MQKITPFLWFDNQAEEAMTLYLSVFKDSREGKISRYGDAGPGPKGSVMSATFHLEGQEFMALNGGPVFHFTPAISLFVNCETQEEVDALWEKLSAGGEKSRCGWLKDRFGLSWQIIPRRLSELLHASDGATSQRVMKAMMQMGKIDINTLERAANGVR
jgi:predicted 3-demethylubiquinone-9 3-methyltransferase (glyoxalase superfamily)